MALSDIVNVTISKQTSQVSRIGFGIPLILTYHTKFAPRTKVVASAQEMLTANGGDFETYDAAYILANVAFSQTPSPVRIVIGRRVHPTIRTVRTTPLSGTIGGESFPRPLTDYPITISRGGVEETFTFTTDGTPTVAEITAGLTGLINGGTVDVKATDNTTDFTVEAAASPGGAATAGIQFSLEMDKRQMAQVDETPVAAGGDLASEIAATQLENDDWYAITGDWYGKIEGEDVLLAIESQLKIHLMASADDDMYDSVATTDIASTLATFNPLRSGIFYHETPESGIASALLGRCLPEDPGSITWKFKSMALIPTSIITDAEADALEAKNANRYITLAGQNITCNGVMSSGEFIDVTRGIDWLQVRLQEDVFSLLANTKKVSFDDPGIAQVENQIRGVLNQGIGVGLLAADPPFTVTVPKASAIDPIDKANRCLTDVLFSATLAGAIHKVIINGTVTV